MPNEIGTIIGPARSEGGDSALALARDDRGEAVIHVFFSIAQGLAVMERYRDGTDPEFWDGLRTCLMASDMAEASERDPVEISGSPAIGIFGAIANAPELWNGGSLELKRHLDPPRIQQCFLSPHPDVDAAMYVVTDGTGSHVLVMRSKTQVRETTERFRHCFPQKLLAAVKGTIPDLPLPDITDAPLVHVEGAAAGVIALAFEMIEARKNQN